METTAHHHMITSRVQDRVDQAERFVTAFQQKAEREGYCGNIRDWKALFDACLLLAKLEDPEKLPMFLRKQAS